MAHQTSSPKAADGGSALQSNNSLDAQRDAGEAYIRSQAGEGWTLLPAQYDDGGYTGANMDRPALRRLLADSQAGNVDCVVVYKVDRLSRSIRDFAKIRRSSRRTARPSSRSPSSSTPRPPWGA
jgi:hypothetical protein